MGQNIPGRVQYDCDQIVCEVHGNITLAQLNAGAQLVPGTAGVQLTVLDFFLRANGSLAGATDVRISDDAAAPVDVVTILAAQMANGNMHTPATGTHTLNAAFPLALTQDAGIQARKTGGAGTTLTSIDYSIRFVKHVSN